MDGGVVERIVSDASGGGVDPVLQAFGQSRNVGAGERRFGRVDPIGKTAHTGVECGVQPIGQLSRSTPEEYSCGR